jgi:membrane protein required for colicin V production
MNWVTIVLVLVIGFVTWAAYRSGFIREFVGLCGVILAVPIAGVFYDDLYPKIHPIVDNADVANLVSFIAIFAAVVIGSQVAAYLLRTLAHALNLGGLDHVAGAIFGFLKAALICQVLLIALVLFPTPDVRDDIDASPIGRALLNTAPAVLSILPQRFDSGIDHFLDGASALDERIGPSPTGTATRTATP